MKELSLVVFGMGMQAMIAGAMNALGVITLSTNQQLGAGVIYLALACVILLLKLHSVMSKGE